MRKKGRESPASLGNARAAAVKLRGGIFGACSGIPVAKKGPGDGGEELCDEEDRRRRDLELLYPVDVRSVFNPSHQEVARGLPLPPLLFPALDPSTLVLAPFDAALATKLLCGGLQSPHSSRAGSIWQLASQ